MHIKFYFLTLLWILSCALMSCQNGSSTGDYLTQADSLSNTASLVEDGTISGLPIVKAYLDRIQYALQQEIPILGIDSTSLTVAQRQAQQLCILNKQFQTYVKDSVGQICRNEIFGVYPARESDFSSRHKTAFKEGEFYRVEMYNFALNITTIGLVHLPSQEVKQVVFFKAMQPELPEHLKEMAIQIAIDNPQVSKALERKPAEKDALMSDTKTALNASKCERSKHLCVAPTFVKDEKALWTIVDLTDLRVAGLRWTNLGDNPVITSLISERTIQNESITNCYCKTAVPITKNDWKLEYMLTSNDGLRISDVYYKGERIVNSAKLVDWHVSYSRTDNFGYSDAVGCPYFSSATVVALEPPRVAELLENGTVVGFTLEQYYRSDAWPSPCNYEYFQRYEFYNDGRFRVAAANTGRGCGNDGTYRPVFRIDFGGHQHTVNEWNGAAFTTMKQEGWRLQNRQNVTEEGTMFQIKSPAFSYELMPSNGQFNDGGRGDQAYVYITVNKSDAGEGDTDLPTIGPCCNTDYQQGPEKFIEPNPESLVNKSVIVWYVPQLKNDDTRGREYCWAKTQLVNGVYKTEAYPCIGGPMFVPSKNI